MMQTIYMAVIEQGEDGFGVFFPDLPGCTSWGATIFEAAKNAVTAAQAHVAMLAEEDEQVPEAKTFDTDTVDKDVKIANTVLVPVEVDDERVRVNITLQKSVLARLDARARARGVDRSSMIAFLATADERGAYSAPVVAGAHGEVFVAGSAEPTIGPGG